MKKSHLIAGILAIIALAFGIGSAAAFDIKAHKKKHKKVYKKLKSIDLPEKHVGHWAGPVALLGQNFFVISKNGTAYSCYAMKKSQVFTSHRAMKKGSGYTLVSEEGMTREMKFKNDKLSLVAMTGLGPMNFDYTKVKSVPKRCLK
jgi:hypothetical protein